MAKALTPKGVEALQPDPARRIEKPDPGLSGLYLVIQPSGAKSWALRYRFGGKPAKLTLGRWPVMGVAEARLAASKAIEAVERGEDPGLAKKAGKTAAPDDDRDKFEKVVGVFMKRHAARNRRADDVAAMFRREVMKPWGSKRIQDITKRDVIDVLDAMVDRGSPVSANRLLAHLRTLFTWAKGRDILTTSPLDGIKPPSAERPRNRVLTDDEIRVFWLACDRLGQPFGSLYQFLLLTGQRLREGAEMTEREVIDGLWTIPAARTKNGDEHTVPLPDAAKDILRGLNRIKGPFMFTTTGESPISGFTRAKSRLDAIMAQAAGDGVVIPPFTIHDLRRTAATGMASLRFPPHIVEAVLNHRSGTRRGVAGVYNRFDYADEKRAALEAWARKVLAIVEDKPDNVVRLADAR
jgi:integrase